jgi:hypothetical protein
MKSMAFRHRHALLLLGLSACSPYGGGAFHCERDDQCTGGGSCEANGLCSFPDPECGSGRRYGELAGDLSRTCVGEDAPIDAPDPDAPDVAIDSAIDGPPPAPFCDASDVALVGCWEFEGTTTDASGDNNHATAQNTTFAAGKVGMGITLGATSLISVADSASLAPPMATVEAWVRPTMLPAGTARMGIFDNNNSYGFFIFAANLTCVMGTTATAPAIAANVWTHVACTYDGTTTRIYINGAAAGAPISGGVALGAGDTSGSVIAGNSPSGDPLIGMIDQVRVWAVERTPQQICAAAGASLCP